MPSYEDVKWAIHKIELNGEYASNEKIRKLTGGSFREITKFSRAIRNQNRFSKNTDSPYDALKFSDTLYGLPDKIVDRILSDETPFAEIVTVTPGMAQHWLGANLYNRRPKTSNIAKLISDMKNDAWEITGESLKIASTGLLIDGQNRLMAIIKAGTSIKTFVTFNLHEDVFNKIDQQSKRLVADSLAIKEVKDPVPAAAISKFVLGVTIAGLEKWICSGGSALHGVSDSKIEAFYFDHQNEIDQAVSISRSTMKLISKALGGGLFYFMYKKDHIKAELFFSGLASGANLKSDSPIFLLREKLLDFRSQNISRRSISADVAIHIIHAWNLFRDNKAVRQLRISSLKGFPTIN